MALTRFVGGNVNGFPARLWRRPAARRWMARGPVALLLLALALALGVLPAQAQADPLASNLEQPRDSAQVMIVGFHELPPDPPINVRAAQQFKTGSHRHGYTLSDLRVFIVTQTTGTEVSVSIHSADSSGDRIDPGSRLYTFDSPSTIVSSSLNTFTAPANATLEPDTDYFVTFEAPTGTYIMERTASGQEHAAQADGWTIYRFYHTDISDDDWRGIFNALRIEINGSLNDIKLVGNMEEGSSGFIARVGIRQGKTHLAAQRFTTGSNGAGYALTSVGAFTNRLTDSSEATVSIYSADSSGNPGSSMYVLTNPATFFDAFLFANTFTADNRVPLERETDYFVVFEGAVGEYRIRATDNFDEDADGADGWSTHDGLHTSDDGGADWRVVTH